MTERIPISRPWFGPEEAEALQQTLASGWVGSGPRTAEFEQRFAQFLGVEHAVALNSASAALHLAMLAAEVDGQEVLTTSMTFVSTNHAILLGGGRPVFCDIEADTLNRKMTCSVIAFFKGREDAQLKEYLATHAVPATTVGDSLELEKAPD